MSEIDNSETILTKDAQVELKQIPNFKKHVQILISEKEKGF